MINMGGVKTIDKEARAYMAKEGAVLVKAGALITDSVYTKMMGNIFLAINQPETPTKLFSDKISALKWLKKYL